MLKSIHRCFCLAGGAIAVLLTGCAPDLGEPPVPRLPQAYATAESFAAPEIAWPQEAWWRAFGDRELDALMADALSDAPDLKLAAARIRAAEAASDIAGADLWPTIGAGAGLQETKQSQNTGYPATFRPYLPQGWHHSGEISASLQYQLDFFGKYRAAAKAAEAMAEVARADAAAARLQLTAAVATTYAGLMQANADRAAAGAMLAIQRSRRELTAARVRKGLDHAAALDQAEASEADGAADVAKLDRLAANVRHQLAALIGAGPDREIILPAGAPMPRSVGLPQHVATALLGRRPDIVAARRNAEAAAANIDVANANFYPNVDLTGMFGVQALDAGLLIQGTSEFGKIGPAITLPLFDVGRLTGVYRKARADYDAAVAVYDKTLTNALREVADAYGTRRALETELAEARKALTSRDHAYGIAAARYRAGLLRRLELLNAESAVVAQRRIVAGKEAEIFAADVALIRALGGGTNDQQSRTADVRAQ